MLFSRMEWENALKDRYGEELYKNFSHATVAICGLGGLGSNIAIALARAGIGKLILIDFDKVELTNLHRQQYKADQVGMLKTEALSQNLKEISPYIAIEAHTVRITEDNVKNLLKNADLICEAFDDAECKAMLANIVLEKMSDKYYIAASGMAGLGDANTIQTHRISKHFFVCGDGTSDVNKTGSLVASRVMVCAAHQAHMVLRILANQISDK